MHTSSVYIDITALGRWAGCGRAAGFTAPIIYTIFCGNTMENQDKFWPMNWLRQQDYAGIVGIP